MLGSVLTICDVHTSQTVDRPRCRSEGQSGGCAACVSAQVDCSGRPHHLLLMTAWSLKKNESRPWVIWVSYAADVAQQGVKTGHRVWKTTFRSAESWGLQINCNNPLRMKAKLNISEVLRIIQTNTRLYMHSDAYLVACSLIQILKKKH